MDWSGEVCNVPSPAAMTRRDTRTSEYRTREYRRQREKAKVQIKGHEPGRGIIWFVYGLPVPATEPVMSTRHIGCALVRRDPLGEVYLCQTRKEE